VLGILVGVAISGSGFVESSERELLEDQIRDLRRDLEQAREQQEQLEDANDAAEAFVDESYTAVMADRLSDRDVAVLFVGQVEQHLLGPVDRAIADAGGERVRLQALELPIDGRLDDIQAQLETRPALAGHAGADNLGNLGRDLAREFVTGGRTPLWDALANDLVQQREGDAQRPADAVVVVRTVEPQRGPTARLLRGVYDGFAGSVPVVGVELTGSNPSAIETFRRSRLSSVDSIDTPVGRVALALLLAGAGEGHYGVKETADAILPPVEPLPPAPAGG
jgi:hypothetical protein